MCFSLFPNRDRDTSEIPINGNTASCTTTTAHVPRSKSNDILKKNSITSSSDVTKTIPRLSHFNTLKQWGRNRLRLIHRNTNSNSNSGGNFSNGSGGIGVGVTSSSGGGGSSDDNKKENKDKVSGIEDINVYETVISKNKRKFMEKERKLSHERKPSYSSSEKSLTIQTGCNTTKHSALPASINPVKLRESSYIRRQRRNGLGHKDEPNSSSGNWSASSESGRTSIGSEITAQPKSSASSTSLNHHPGSGPPSSIISRRRFLNTSTSSSVTSEGTVTPDIQVHDTYDDETSSAYSCDTEGYYTSFHVDSGLKTLKEEEPVTPLHTSSALSSTNSFGSSSNKTVLSAENEYELFGKGSTSTTASSAGTVCTTLMAANSDRCLVNGPAVPERKSSLTKLNRSNSNASNSTLERSYSSSTVGSTLERTGTIKRNGILLKKEVAAVVHHETKIDSSMRIESPDSGNNTSSSPIETNSNSSPTHCLRSNSEYDYSESSDLEGVDRVERIRVKTTINSSRIPSMCVITPVNSDDDDDHHNHQHQSNERERQSSPICCETDLDTLEFNPNKDKQLNKQTSDGYATIHKVQPSKLEFKKEVRHIKKSTLQPLNNMFDRLRGVLPQLKKSPVKDKSADEPIYDNAGEYVRICDVANNNQKKVSNKIIGGGGGGGNGIYFSNDILRRNLATVLSGNINEETEYVSLNELPASIRCESNLLLCSGNTNSNNSNSNRKDEKINNADPNNSSSSTTKNECVQNSNTINDCDEEGLINRRGARVTLDAQGKVIYSSDSLKRRKGAHTTFIPGPCVKDFSSTITSDEKKSYLPPSSPIVSGGLSNRKLSIIRPVISQKTLITEQRKFESINNNLESASGIKQTDKIIIRAGDSNLNNFGTTINNSTEIVRMPIATIITPTSNSPTTSTVSSAMLSSENINNMSSGNGTTSVKRAYVNVQGNINVSTELQGKNIKINNHYPINAPPTFQNTNPNKNSSSSYISKSEQHRDTHSDNLVKIDNIAIKEKIKRSNSYKMANSSILSNLISDYISPNSVVEKKQELLQYQIKKPITESFIPAYKNSFSSSPIFSFTSSLTTNSFVAYKEQQQQNFSLKSKQIDKLLTYAPNVFVDDATTLPSSSLSSFYQSSPTSAFIHQQEQHDVITENCIDNGDVDKRYIEVVVDNIVDVFSSQQKNSTSTILGNSYSKTIATTSSPSIVFEDVPLNKNDNENSTIALLSTAIVANSEKNVEHKSIAKSFEKLMDEFSLSTSFGENSPISDSSYLKNKSIENIESSDEFFDSDNEVFGITNTREKIKKAALSFYTLSPNKITIPIDSKNHQARVLSFSECNASTSTDIW